MADYDSLLGGQKQPVRRFAARFDSDCHHCGAEILEGDQIAYLPGYDRPACTDCVDYHEGN